MTSPYRDPGQEREFLDQEFKSFFAEADAEAAATEAAQAAQEAAKAAAQATRDAENRYWGFAEPPEELQHREHLPEGVFRLVDVVKEPWCAAHYKTPSRLIKWLLKVHGYPDRLTDSGFITRAGFDILMETKLLAEDKSDLARKTKARAAKRVALAEARQRFLKLLCLRADVLV